MKLTVLASIRWVIFYLAPRLFISWISNSAG